MPLPPPTITLPIRSILANLFDPTEGKHASTKSYVDSLIPVSSNTAPSNPLNGVLWVDTAISPYVLKLRYNNEWVIVSGGTPVETVVDGYVNPSGNAFYVYGGNFYVQPTTANVTNGYVYLNDVFVYNGDYFSLPTTLPPSDFIYTTTLTGVTITGYEGIGGSVEIPSLISGMPVTRIESNAFDNISTLLEIVIPDSVTSIGEYAFYNCANITTLTIPDSVINIGAGAFESCTGLTSVTFSNLLTRISSRMFSGCVNLTDIVIPDSATSIDSYAFQDCINLTSLVIGSNVTSIGDYAFSLCNSLPIVSIPSNVRTIGDSAFHFCEALTSLTISNGVISIGNSAFAGCSLITTLGIPNSVTSIGGYAFWYCQQLTTASIGTGVASLGQEVFSNCTLLESIYFQGNAPTNSSNWIAISPTAIVYYKLGKTGWGTVFAGKPTQSN